MSRSAALRPVIACGLSGALVLSSFATLPSPALADENQVTAEPLESPPETNEAAPLETQAASTSISGLNLLALANDGVLTLNDDYSLVSTLTVAAGTTLTIDLNGHAITAAFKRNSTTQHLFAISNSGTLTITDSKGGGSITSRGVENFEGGTLTLKAGEVVAQDETGGAAVWNLGSFTMENGTLRVVHQGKAADLGGPIALHNLGTATIAAGSIVSDNAAAYAAVSEGALTFSPAEDADLSVSGARGGLRVTGGTATINGGSFAGTTHSYGLLVDSTAAKGENDPQVVINAGSFSGNGYSVWAEHTSGPAVKIAGGTFAQRPGAAADSSGLSITGGTFSAHPGAKNLADGMEAFEENGVWRVRRDLSATNVEVVVETKTASETYTGRAIKPELTVTWDGQEVKQGTEYLVETLKDGQPADAVNVGSYRVRVVGTGTYKGVAATMPTFTVVPADLGDAVVTVSPTSFPADGKPHALGVTVSLAGVALAEDDYEVSIVDATGTTVSAPKDPGVYTVHVTGKNNCTGKAPVAQLQVLVPADESRETHTETTDPETGAVTVTDTKTSLDGTTVISTETVTQVDGSSQITKSTSVTRTDQGITSTTANSHTSKYAADGKLLGTVEATQVGALMEDGSSRTHSTQVEVTYGEGGTTTITSDWYESQSADGTKSTSGTTSEELPDGSSRSVTTRADGTTTTVATSVVSVCEAKDGQPSVTETLVVTTVVDPNGATRKTEETRTTLHDASGAACTGWQYAGAWYYAGPTGLAETGEQVVDGKTYVFEDDGTMKVGWHDRTGSGDWTFLYAISDGHLGEMVRNDWYYDDGWYLFGGNGQMLRGWQISQGQQYYLGPDGKMLTGWQFINGGWFWFNSNGAMARNTTVPGGFFVGPDGRWIPAR